MKTRSPAAMLSARPGAISITPPRALCRCPVSDHAVGGVTAEVDGVAAIGARDHRSQRRRPALRGRGPVDAHFGEPPEQVAAAITARQAAVGADRQIDAASGALQLFGDLRARRAGAGHQHRARRKLLRISVVRGMDLKHRMIAQQVRDQRALIGAGGDHDIVGLDGAAGGFGDKAGSAIAPAQPRHLDAAADRRCDERCIGVDEPDDLTGGGEGVRIGVRKRKIRQPHRPVRKLKRQAVPAFAAPAFGDPLPFQHQMRKPALLEPVAHHEARPGRRRSPASRPVQPAWRAPLRRAAGSAAARMIQRRNAAKSRCSVRKPR